VISRLAPKIVIAFGAVAFLVTIAIPAASLAWSIFFRNETSSTIIGGLSSRQWGIVIRTVGLATTAAFVSILASLPAAYLLGRIGRVSTAPLTAVAIASPLMLPPMVLTFGWQRILGPHTVGLEAWAPMMRTVWTWALWSWPIPAIIIGSGWSRTGRSAYEAGLLATSRTSAFARAVLPLLSRHVMVSGLLLMAIFLGEYTVPHANGVIVIATELLSISQSSSADIRAVEVVRLSLPIIALIVAAIAIAHYAAPRRVIERTEPGRLETRGRSVLPTLIVAGVVITSVGVPLIALVRWSTIGSDLYETVTTYHSEILGTFAVCGLSGVVAAAIGLTVTLYQRCRAIGIITLVVIGIVPGALVGEAVLAAYQRFPAVYDHWTIVVIALAGRYAWIGALASWIAISSIPRDELDATRIDGAANPIVTHLWVQWPVLLAGAFLAAAMAMSDVDTVAMVQVPTLRMVATIIIEKFHRFETGALVSLSIAMVTAAVPAVVAAALAMRGRE
jgi:ABC-type Fe3+ transport system permease subunit